ncbi:MAG: hypothetical protein IKD31_00920 [Clostridia bacterium]|nr:hypothetical protein [Clostridia bacterium]
MDEIFTEIAGEECIAPTKPDEMGGGGGFYNSKGQQYPFIFLILKVLGV